MKNFLLKLEIKTSSIPNEYHVLRKNIFVASVTVVPGKSYQIKSLRTLSFDEVQYLRKKFKKIANLSDKETQMHITM